MRCLATASNKDLFNQNIKSDPGLSLLHESIVLELATEVTHNTQQSANMLEATKVVTIIDFSTSDFPIFLF